MYKAASRKIGIFLAGFVLLAGAAIAPPSLCAGMHELSDGEMAVIYAQGFSTFTLSTDTNGNSLVALNFSGVTLSTWTEIQSMKMGYYLKGTTAWDNDWTNVSLGTSSTDLVAQGLYIKAGFSGDITNPATRQLEYVQIGTTSLTGPISANFNSFSGTLDNGVTNINRTNLGAATITSNGGGFYLSLSRIGVGNQMGYSFNWGSATKTP
jgi:hypothetical protein